MCYQLLNARRTPSDAIELNRNKLHKTSLQHTPFTQRFICGDLELTFNQIPHLLVLLCKNITIIHITDDQHVVR